jgi:hypothetical protein
VKKIRGKKEKKKKRKRKRKYWTHYHDQVGMFKSQAADFSLECFFWWQIFAIWRNDFFENNIIMSNIIPFFF